MDDMFWKNWILSNKYPAKLNGLLLKLEIIFCCSMFIGTALFSACIRVSPETRNTDIMFGWPILLVALELATMTAFKWYKRTSIESWITWKQVGLSCGWIFATYLALSLYWFSTSELSLVYWFSDDIWKGLFIF